MGWISEKVKEDLKTRSNALPDISEGKEKLEVEDHIRSLLFILRLSRRDFDMDEISELEDEVTEIASYPGEILDLDTTQIKKSNK